MFRLAVLALLACLPGVSAHSQEGDPDGTVTLVATPRLVDPDYRGAVLLAVYALGLGAAFVVTGIAFTRAMSTFRWLRDRYTVIQVVSGLVLVALGLLLFFHRDWWLHVALNRTLDAIGLTKP